ncbi:(2Fe-2S)-binding protein [Jejuia spongiicola]|uniref:(2Fe-2S)-binding protein n=1 Tax=Jejuia spongiicola TaxID=2942207 RepID=A0ABT0QDX2_9FLAO|nr:MULTISPECIES: (2Fe-2S)-binding protein [Flavobacteriaceae]MCL6295181.1 (2Fe-2S)-binding protein [Jejuia spongiicola]PIA77727.1 (2Fe-2S)-binding protein [Gaetbulibacter sp. 4G1]
MPTFNLKINNETHAVEADMDTPLLWVLRDQINLVGTKYGCGIGQCGACTVHVDGVATRSCLLQISQAEGLNITTIEGLSENGNHPVQEAWKDIDVPQCGYCQSGQIMTASAFLKRNPSPSSSEIRNAMHGNICRCASYNSIEKAVKVASEKLS